MCLLISNNIKGACGHRPLYCTGSSAASAGSADGDGSRRARFARRPRCSRAAPPRLPPGPPPGVPRPWDPASAGPPSPSPPSGSPPRTNAKSGSGARGPGGVRARLAGGVGGLFGFGLRSAGVRRARWTARVGVASPAAQLLASSSSGACRSEARAALGFCDAASAARSASSRGPTWLQAPRNRNQTCCSRETLRSETGNSDNALSACRAAL